MWKSQPVILLAADRDLQHVGLAHQTRGGTRPALDSGHLAIVIVAPPGSGPPSPGRSWQAPRLDVSADEPVHAGVDGEPADLIPPLHFTIRPAALRVRISRRLAGTSPAVRVPRSPRPRQR